MKQLPKNSPWPARKTGTGEHSAAFAESEACPRFALDETRRHFFGRSATGIGIAALSSLISPDLASADPVIPGFPNFPPTAKRVIYLFQHGAPSQLDLFDYKPALGKQRGTDLPESIRNGQRLTGMSAFQTKFHSPPRRPSSNSRNTAKAVPGSASFCLTPRKSSTTSPSSAPCRPSRSITTQPSRFSRPASNSPAAPASAHGSLTV